MSGGAVSIGLSYLRESSVEVVRYGVFVPVIASVTLFVFLSTEPFDAFALYTVVGMVCYFSQLAISTDDGAVEEGRPVKLALSIIIVLYLNALVFLGVATGSLLVDLGYGSAVPTVLLLLPLIDAELGRRELPSLTLLTGECVRLVLFVAERFDGVEPASRLTDTLSEIQTRLNEDSPEFFHEALIHRTEQSSLPWV
ncbi:MAG: hypothetical protein ABEI99_05090 [Halobaculum sp.]